MIACNILFRFKYIAYCYADLNLQTFLVGYTVSMFSYVNIEFRYRHKINTSEFSQYVLYNIQILDLNLYL